MKIFYTLGVNLYTFAVSIAAIWVPKAKKLIRGRRAAWGQLSSFEPKSTVIWFHCASLGEFEQGRPLMERIKEEKDCQIVLTFFSPSGYEIRKDYDGVDLVVYLPKDSKRNARKFLNAIKPAHVFFIKYEFWANYILECNSRDIPIYSVAALFRKDQIFFKSYGGFMRKVLRSFSKVFVQNEESQEILKKIDVASTVCGDTRYDRVMKNAENVKKYPEVKQFCSNAQVLVCGSIWEEDLNVLQKKINDLSEWKIIIAPHEINERFLAKIESSIQKSSVRYSLMDENSDEEVLIIDNVGMLMNLYQYGDIAFVGGGFRTGLHNILEPAAFGLPVFFGNKYDKFPEAYSFIENDIGFPVSNSEQFYFKLDQVLNNVPKEKVKTFMKSQMGATDMILKEFIS